MEQCQHPEGLEAFLKFLPEEIVTFGERDGVPTVTIHADVGDVVWIFIDYLNKFCVEGGIGQQFIGTLL